MTAQRYLVTARKYRPQLFEELVAQEHVTETLKNAIRFDRLAHAYLFSGPRGVGKTTAARILAKAINCTTPLDQRGNGAEPCRECESCRTFEEGRSLNIIEIDAASNNKVDDIRELRDTVRIPPQGGRKKVYIVDEVHMLSSAAFNALLKTLEEPPPHVLFIFATTEPHKVLPTILSRCQRFDFRRIAVPEIVSRLEDICAEEEITADEASLMLIARKGDGALRDALSVFDQAVSLCGSNLQYSELAQVLGVVDIDLFFDVTDFVIQRDTAGMLTLVDRIMRSGYDLLEFLAGLAEHLRNVLVARTMSDTALIEAPDATRQRYEGIAGRFTETDLLRLITLVSDAEDSIKNSPQPRLKLETALLKMATISLAVDLREAIQKIERLEVLAGEGTLSTSSQDQPLPKRQASPRVEKPASKPPSGSQAPSGSKLSSASQPPSESQARSEPQPSSGSRSFSEPQPPHRVKEPPAEPAGAPSKEPAAPSDSSSPADVLGTPAIQRRTPPSNDDAVSQAVAVEVDSDVATEEAFDTGPLGSVWSDLLSRVKEDRIHVGSLLQHSRPEEFRDGTAVVGVPDDFHRRLLTSQQDYVVEQIQALLSMPLRAVRFIVRDDLEAPDAEETASDFNPYEYMQRKRQENPVIRAIFDQFGGELVW
jgi:DNA polymerase-3 subunit gamma/tau